MKKRLVILFLLLIFAPLAACGNSATPVKIETAKAGKIDTSVYDQTEIKEKQKAALTPLVKVNNEKQITDDGNELYNIKLLKNGEGEVSVASTKVKAGTSVTINATPANEYKVLSYLIDGHYTSSNTFTMPGKDIVVEVSFVNMRHEVGLAGYGDYNYINLDYTSAIEGTKCYFSLNEEQLQYYYYYDEDVFVRSAIPDQNGEYEKYPLTNEGNSTYSFIMPQNPCVIGLNKRSYVTILDAIISINGDQIYENVDDYIRFNLSSGGESINVNENIKKEKVLITLDYLNSLYEIEYITMQEYGSAYNFSEATKVDNNHYEMMPLYGYLFINLKKVEKPDDCYYTTCATAQGGSISVNMPWAKPGDEVTVNASPEEGYRLIDLRYTYTDNENEVSVPIAEQNGNYSFTMVNKDVNIVAMFASDDYVKCTLNIIIETNYVTNQYTINEAFDQIYQYINGGFKEDVTMVNDTAILMPKAQSAQLGFTHSDFLDVSVVINKEHQAVSYSSYYIDILFTVPSEDFVIDIYIIDLY